MGFGEELWDKWDDVMKLADDHIKEMNHMREYLKEYSKLECKHANDLKVLATKYQKPQKHSLETFSQVNDATSLGKAWAFMLANSLVIASKHEDFSREINDGPINTLKEVVKLQEKERKLHYAQGQVKIRSQKQATLVMSKAREEYFGACKHAERELNAAAQYDQYPNKTSERVKQFATSVHKAEKKAAQAHTKYAEQVNTLNTFNANHHRRDMPQIFQQVEEAMSARIGVMKQVIVDIAESQTTKMPDLLECMQNIKSTGQMVSEADDLVGVCSMLQTGPMDYEVFFEEFSAAKGTKKKAPGAKTGYDTAKPLDLHNIPHKDRDMAINKRLEEIESLLAKLHKDQAGVEGLAVQYRENPSWGDGSVPESQLAEISRQCQELDSEKLSLQSQYSGDVHSLGSSVASTPRVPSPVNGHYHNHALAVGWVEAQEEDGNTYYYHEDGVTPSQYEHPGYADDGGSEQTFADGTGNGTGNVGEFVYNNAVVDEGSKTPSAGGQVKALYAFTDDGEGLLPMAEGELLTVVAEASDGWMHVQNANGAEGYVPEGYVAPA